MDMSQVIINKDSKNLWDPFPSDEIKTTTIIYWEYFQSICVVELVYIWLNHMKLPLL